jgi:hypothetical protein
MQNAGVVHVVHWPAGVDRLDVGDVSDGRVVGRRRRLADPRHDRQRQDGHRELHGRVRAVRPRGRDLEAPGARFVKRQVRHIDAAALQTFALEGRVGLAFERAGAAVEDEGSDVHRRVGHRGVVVGDPDRHPLLIANHQL